MKNKMKITASMLAFVALLVVTTGVTLAYYSYKGVGKTENTITSGGITFHYKEINGKGHGISITDALPVASNEDAKLSDKYFDFKITSTTMDGVTIPYIVTARMDNGSDSILGNIIDIYLTEVNGNSETPTALFAGEYVKYNELEDYEHRGSYTEKVIYTDTVSSASYEKNFRLRMWIDARTNLNTGNGQSNYNNKTFSITVNVNAKGNVIANNTEEEIDPTDPRSPFYDNPISEDAGLYTDTGVEQNDTQILSWQQLLDGNYLSVNEDGVLSYGSDRDGLKALEGRLVLDRTVKSINKATFAMCEKISGYKIPDTVTTIGNNAFTYNYALKSISIPNSVTAIGTYAFRNNSSLETVKLSANLTYIGNGTFYQCGSLEEINIPKGVTSIGAEAFDQCTSLTTVKLPSTLTTISYSFKGCTSLENIDIPNSVETLDGTFNGCTGLKTVKLSSNLVNLGGETFKNCTSLESITIPDSVVRIQSSTFQDSGIKNITLPNDLRLIETQAFAGCSSLKSIDLPNSLVGIQNAAFSQSGLERIDIPTGVTTIPDSAFSYCESLTEVNLPTGLETIATTAFARTTNLTSITIPATVTYIGKNAFEISGLTSATFIDPTGWTVDGTIVDFSTPTIAATNLTSSDNRNKEFTKQ